MVEGWSIPQHRTPYKSLLLRNITITGGRWSKKQHIAHAHTRVNITRKMRATGILWLLYQTFQEIPEHQDCKRIPEATDVAQRCSRREILTELYKRTVEYLTHNDPKLVYIYGDLDPWGASGVAGLPFTKNKTNLHVYVCKGGSHRARILSFPEPTRQEIINLISGWLKE